MKKNFTFIATLLCAVVLGLTGCKDSRRAYSDKNSLDLDNLIEALSEDDDDDDDESIARARRSIDRQARDLNRELPEDIDDGMRMMSAGTIGDTFTYIIEVDEDYYDMSELKSNKSVAKQSIVEEFEDMDSDVREFLQEIVDGRMNLAYRYQGSETGTTFTVVLTRNELIDLLADY